MRLPNTTRKLYGQMNWNDLEDIERFQRLFVEPMVKSVREELKPLTEMAKDTQERVVKLEKNQGRALVGVGAVALLISTATGLGVDWVRRRLGF